MDVRLTTNTALQVELDAARRRGLQTGGEIILALSDLNAPREETPRHDVHMTETGFVRPEVTGLGDRVAVGYGAFWAVWQHERLDYHHTVGHAKFLERALIEGEEAALAAVAAAVRGSLG